MATKLEMSAKDTLGAFAFIAIVLITIGLSMSGVVKSPLTLGLIVTFAVVMVLFGQILVNTGVLPKAALPMWYAIVFGLSLIVYGAVTQGWLPAVAVFKGSVFEVAVITALFYILVLVAIVVLAVAVYLYVTGQISKVASRLYHAIAFERSRMRYVNRRA